MPTVPTYGPGQVRDEAQGTPYASAPSGDGGVRATAAALGTAGDVIHRELDQNNVDVAQRAEATMKTDFVKFESEARAKAVGRDAVGYADTIKNWWDEAGKKYGENLNAPQQKMIGRSLQLARTQSYAGALRHEETERDRSELESFNATKLAEIQRAGASGDPAVAATSVELLKQRNQEMGARKGWTPEVTEQHQIKDTTALHVNMISRLMVSDPKAASDYFNANKKEIDGTRHDEIGATLNKVVAVTDGENAAGEIWAASKPAYNKPIDRPAMEDEIRKRFANDPTRMHAAMTSLRERVVAHNEAEKEANAGNVNAVMPLASQPGVSIAQVQRMPQFQALPGVQQAQIITHLESLGATRASRAAAVESRADAAESRKERALTRNGQAKFYELSDPAVLATMTEAQVQAQLPVLGPQLTNHLVEKYRSTKNDPTKKEEWKMDTEDFNHVAEQMGMKPFEKKSDEEKASLGELKYRVEQVIGTAQKAKGKPLTRDEKNALMTQEMARTVKTGGIFGFFQDDKPVISLSQDDIAKVEVPAADRAQIIEAMKPRFEKTGDKQFAPTEENVKRFYLRAKSRAADYLQIPNAK